MSIKVKVEDLGDEIATRGSACFVVTVGSDAVPKVHHSTVSWRSTENQIVAEVGGGTARNALERSAVTLVWPAPDSRPGLLHLLVDGTAVIADADADPPTVVIAPTSAIRHRVAGDGHACGPST
jgi:hypothetical protein